MIDDATMLIVPKFIAITEQNLFALPAQRHHDNVVAILGRDMRRLWGRGCQLVVRP
jgi:hypothetical protein